MKFEIDPRATEILATIEADPLVVLAKYIFLAGAVMLFLLMLKRHKMSVLDSLKAIVGFKRVVNRDWLFNLAHFAVIFIPLVLMAVGMSRQLSQ
ncbi:hypothetical protein A3715_28460 [Oleiphilus sp. HI0009]|nr:hypothetical protein A3715_19665 [Oleiphilus sp. HI0009]KZX85318.1 hypothetical protein A3715_28460 [Oleiphilus sp. HI0009]